ncbi:predicted protein [Chaetoceros tenuissimus]|uniref:Uncharacterized protein n=1 Tax=Chaetoceros tenuissimus TaxID=426638 RepID=A0AAD3CYF0_9STRA|nr:predicted protein [Chaetoceros tenuissimus]
MSTLPSQLFKSLEEGDELDWVAVLYTLLEILREISLTLHSDLDLFSWTSSMLLNQLDADLNLLSKIKDDNLREWKYGIKLLCQLLGKPNGDNDELHISPHEILRITIECCIGCNYEIDCEHDNDGTNSDQNELFKCLCVMILSTSMKECALSKPKRWRRAQSMCFESLAMFQKLFIAPMNDSDITQSVFTFSRLCILWKDHLSKSLKYMIDVMEKTNKGPDESKTKAMCAAMVGVDLSMIFHVAVSLSKAENVIDDDQRYLFIASLIKDINDIPILPLEFIWMHAERVHNEKQRELPIEIYDEYGEEEMNVALSILQDLSPLLCHPIEDFGIDFEMLCNLQLQWQSEALGIILFIAKRQSVSIPILESMESKGLFYVTFPYVPILLEYSESLLNVTDPSQSSSSNYFMNMGLHILQEALGLEGVDGLLLDETRGAINPINTIQLLLNLVMNASSRSTTFSFQDYNTTVWTKQKLITMIRQLLSIYTTPCQIMILKNLTSNCPYQFLIPLIIDLARTIVYSADATETKSLLGLIHSYIDDITSLLTSENGEMTMLFENVEIFISVVSLLRLIHVHFIGECEVRNQIQHHIERMKNPSNVLNQIVEKSDGPDTFRLFLMQNAFRDLFATIND